jgi:exopolyphosphatase/guanosine-5'-triphosphate,3'-diphosphate pyrophosphatase
MVRPHRSVVGTRRAAARQAINRRSALSATIADKRFDRVIGTSGTILSLGALALSEDGAAGDEHLRNRRVTATAIHRLRKRLSSVDLDARLHIDGLDPRRADIAVAGSIMLDSVVRRLGVDELTLCDLALREGLVLATSTGIRPRSARSSATLTSAAERHRAGRALRLRVSALAPRVAARLVASTRRAPSTSSAIASASGSSMGALLHDAGVHRSTSGTIATPTTLIKNGELRGFDPQEIEIIALLARYHRQATPKKTHDGYGASRKPPRTVRTLAAMLRLAEGLDRSHAGRHRARCRPAREDT